MNLWIKLEITTWSNINCKLERDIFMFPSYMERLYFLKNLKNNILKQGKLVYNTYMLKCNLTFYYTTHYISREYSNKITES